MHDEAFRLRTCQTLRNNDSSNESANSKYLGFHDFT